MYDPSVGRWLEEDPIGFDAGDMDLYRYVGNDPTNATDPSGLAKLIVVSTPSGPDGGVSVGCRIAQIFYVSYDTVFAQNTNHLMDTIRGRYKPGSIDVIEFWGHGGMGYFKIGDTHIDAKTFGKKTRLDGLKVLLSPNAKVIFRTCSTFADPNFATSASKYFGCTVGGHTEGIATELSGGRIGWPTYPGYQELKPGGTPGWTGPPSTPSSGPKKPPGK